MQHLTSLVTFLVHQLVTNGQETWEAGLDNLVKVLTIIALGRLVAERAANSQETLQTSQNGAGIIGIQQLQGEVHEARPAAWEIALQNSLQDRNELLANQSLGGGQDGHETVSDASLLIFGYNRFVREGFGMEPRPVDAVLDVDHG